MKKSERKAKDSEPRGIVVGLGPEEKHPGPFWAYLWSADDDSTETHWHEVVPVARSA